MAACTLKVALQQQDIYLMRETNNIILGFNKGSKTCIKRVPTVTPRLIRKGFFVDFKMLSFPYSPFQDHNFYFKFGSFANHGYKGFHKSIYLLELKKKRLVIFQI